jgi:transcriptional regulator with XRE-family HTH domain
MDAGRLVHTARLRSGLTQRELARRAHIPQPMVSVIERGQQDPRHGTLVRLLRACGLDLDLVPLAGAGVDRSQFVETLRLTPTDRVRRALRAADFVRRVRTSRAQ